MARKHTALLTELIPSNASDLPIHEPVAVYYRQSGKAQIGNRSTVMQNVDMPAELRQRGWTDDLIILIDMDKGISAQKAIDQRPGMKEVFGMITDGKIRTVATVDEDRLFRDLTMIQPNIFIQVCIKARVLIITPSIIYDFCDPTMGKYHVKLFRARCEAAADYIEFFIKGKLLRNRHFLIAAGQPAGGSTTPGYMVHTCERRYYPFQPYAEVVNEYFRLFLSFAGNLHATERHIERYGPYYPDVQPPDGFKADYHRLGKYPGRVGLKYLLTNPLYLGHWTHGGEVIRWNNHEPIVPLDIFMRAFNYLSPVALDGTPNKHYQPFRENARPTLDENRPVERPLYAGMILASIDGTWHHVGAQYVTVKQHYFYTLEGDHRYWMRSANTIDQALDTLVLDKLASSFDDDRWQKALAEARPNYQKERRHKAAQIEALERTLEGYARNLPTLKSQTFIRRAEAQFEAAEAERKRLVAELAALDNEAQQFKALDDLKADIGPALREWDHYPRDKKRTILHRVIDRIEMESTEGRGTRLIITWRDRQVTTAVLRMNHKSGIRWKSTGMRSEGQR